MSVSLLCGAFSFRHLHELRRALRKPGTELPLHLHDQRAAFHGKLLDEASRLQLVVALHALACHLRLLTGRERDADTALVVQGHGEKFE